MAGLLVPHTLTHEQRVCRLYRRTLELVRDLTMQRHLFHQEVKVLRVEFKKNKHIVDPRLKAKLIQVGEQKLQFWANPDPYKSPEAPGGSKWQRNLPVPKEWTRPEAFIPNME